MISRRTLLTGAAAVAVAPMLPAVVEAEPVIEYLPPSDLLKQMLDVMAHESSVPRELVLYGTSYQQWLPDAAAKAGLRLVMLPPHAVYDNPFRETKEAGAE